jgi:hypothetical protein
MRPINFKGGLKRIWVVLSGIYLIFVLVVLVMNRDCVGGTARLAKAQSIESRNNPKISRLMDSLPKELRNYINENPFDLFSREEAHEQALNNLDDNLDEFDIFKETPQKKLNRMRKKYSRSTSEISDLKAEIKIFNSNVGRCSREFIWSFDKKQYANIGTMIGTTLGLAFGGLILLWGSLYVLFGIGWGLPYIFRGVWRGLCWIKDGFTEGSSRKSNELETRIDDEEGK